MSHIFFVVVVVVAGRALQQVRSMSMAMSFWMTEVGMNLYMYIDPRRLIKYVYK